jgi:hypothetical protein
MSGDPQLIGTVAGLTVARWGVGGAGTSALGIVQSARRRKASEEYKLKNPSGKTIAHLFYDHRDEVEMEVIALDAAALPNIGDSFAVAGVTAVVTGCEEGWQQEDFCKFTVTAVKHAGVALA